MRSALAANDAAHREEAERLAQRVQAKLEALKKLTRALAKLRMQVSQEAAPEETTSHKMFGGREDGAVPVVGRLGRGHGGH